MKVSEFVVLVNGLSPEAAAKKLALIRSLTSREGVEELPPAVPGSPPASAEPPPYRR